MNEDQGVKPASALPRIYGGVCEFCGVSATKCAHALAFLKAGKLDSGPQKEELNKIYQNFKGLPRVINKICEFCGVDANDQERCQHYAQRAKLAAVSPMPSRKTVETKPDGTIIEEEKPLEAEKPKVVPSGDAEMDAMMDEE